MQILFWGGAALLTGLGVKFAGDGLENTGEGARDIAVGAAIVGGMYLLAKKQGVI